jgi:hypothetical protein
MTDPDVVQVWEVPDPNTLTFADLDEILRLTGIDVPTIGDAGKVLAALVTWRRAQSGETVSFDEVYKTLTLAHVRVSRMDPTQPAPTG